MKVFVYCRKSTDDRDKQILSLDNQEEVAKKFCAENNFDIVQIYKESKSSKRPDIRPLFSEMVKRLYKHEVDAMVTWKADRLARNAKEGGMLIDLVDYGGMKIITPFMEYNRNNSTFLFIEFGMATKYSKDLGDNTKRGLNKKIEMGWFPGMTPLGYINNKFMNNGEKDIKPDPERWDLVRKWWDMMLTGKYSVEGSMRAISKYGLRTKSGKKLNKSTAVRIFHNIFYAGFFNYLGKIYQGKHKPMVSLSEYNKVQKLIKTPIRTHTNNNYFFIRALKCGECGSTIVADKQIRHYKYHDRIFVYARCNKYKGKCSQKMTRAEELERQTIEYINNIQISPRLAEWIKDVLKKRNEKEFEFEKQQKIRQTNRIVQILTEKKNIYGMKCDGLISDEEFQKEKLLLLNEERLLKEQMNESGIPSWTDIMEETLSFASNIQHIFENTDPDGKRLILKLLGSNLTLKDGMIHIDGRNVFVCLKNTENKVLNENDVIEPNIVPYLGDNMLFLEEGVTQGFRCGNHSRLFHILRSDNPS